MFEYLNSNPLIVLAIGVFVVFVFMFTFTKGAKSKKKKDDAKPKEEKKEKQEDSKSEKESESQEQVAVDVKKKKKIKKAKQKPQIEFVYKKAETQSKEEKKEDDSSKVDSDLNARAQFVKSSNKVSKFVGLSDIVNSVPEGVNDETINSVPEIAEENAKTGQHFDHSRRLSKMVQDDAFDDMLQAHISEKYMNINSEKHLRFDDDFSEKLLSRASKTIDNSSNKIQVDEEGNVEPREKVSNDKDYMKNWLQQQSANRMYDETQNSDNLQVSDTAYKKSDLDLSAKNIMVVDAILHRKGKDKRKR